MIAGYDRLRSLAGSGGVIVPGHDPMVFERHPPADPSLSGIAVRLGLAGRLSLVADAYRPDDVPYRSRHPADGVGPRGRGSQGFDSLWFPEHSHIPTSRRTPWGGSEGAAAAARGVLAHARPVRRPDRCGRGHDQRCRLGTGITLVAQRDPVWLAKEVASLDVISGGRFMFGIGYGWNHEEMETHGVDIAHRRAVVREKILACKALWTQEEAEFHGKYVNLEPSWSWPKPVQFPHPPIVVGCSPTDLHFRHIIEYADVWMPIEGRWPIDEAWQSCSKMRQRRRVAIRPSLSLGIFRRQAGCGSPRSIFVTSARPLRR